MPKNLWDLVWPIPHFIYCPIWLNSKKDFIDLNFFKFQNPISLGVYQIWNPFVNWFTSEASLKLMARGLPLHLTNLLKPIWVVMESSVLKIWSTKSSLLATISNMFLTCCGPSNWTLPMVDGARKPTILLKVVILVAVKTKSMLFSVTWFRNIPTFLKVKFSTIFLVYGVNFVCSSCHKE